MAGIGNLDYAIHASYRVYCLEKSSMGQFDRKDFTLVLSCANEREVTAVSYMFFTLRNGIGPANTSTMGGPTGVLYLSWYIERIRRK
jgi:hypothetical protein